MRQLNAIVLVTLDPVDRSLAERLGAFLARRCGLDVVRSEIDLGSQTHLDATRNQVDSAALMQALSTAAPPDYTRVLALLQRDLFLPMLTFLFGHAQLDGRLAMVSLARLRQEFYGLPPDAALLQLRLNKESLHELGHTFGLLHCDDEVCCMSLSSTIAQVDAKGDDFCPGCRALVREHRVLLGATPASVEVGPSPEVRS